MPTVPARKQQQDTAATLAELARIGVPPDRLRLVFNQVDDDNPIEHTFDTLLAYCASSGVVAAAIWQPSSRSTRSTRSFVAPVNRWPKLAADSTDYKAAIAKAGTQSDKLALAHRLAIQRLARGVLPELEACFAALDLRTLAQQSGEAEVPEAS